MICKNCRGVQVPPNGYSGNSLVMGGGGGGGSAVTSLTVYYHGMCRGGTWCDCQHKPPKRPVPRAGEHPTLDQ